MSLHRFNPCIVGCETQRQITLITFEKQLQVAHSCIDIFDRIIDIADIMQTGRLRHELHQTLSSLMRAGLGIKIRLNLNHRPNQMGVHTIAIRCCANDSLKLGASQRMDWDILAPLPDARLITGRRNIAKMEHSL